MLSKLVIGFIGYVALMTISHGQIVTVTGNIPYAKDLKNDDGTLKVWTISKIRDDKIYTVNPIEGDEATVMERDSNSRGLQLGDRSSNPETKPIYEGTLDLTSTVLPASIAILVDDIATLTITEIPRGNEPAGHTPFRAEPYEVKGSALWKAKSYKEFPIPLPPGRKYDLKLVYTNTANLTANYPDGKIDIDGVSVYVSLLPGEVRGYATDEYKIGIGQIDGRNVEEWRRKSIRDLLDYTKLKTENKSKLKIVQWENVFDANNESAFEHAEFKKDLDIFRVRFPDIPVPAGSSEHRIKIWTTYKNGAVLDTGAEVDLNIFPANGAAPAFHETAALALVPNDSTDDEYAVEGKEDGHLGDRTYRAELGGKVKIQWLTAPGAGPKPILELPVPAERVVKIIGLLLKGTTDVATATPWFERAKKIYSAVGVDLQYSFDTIDPLPIGVELDIFDLPVETAKYQYAMSDESRQLLKMTRDKVPDNTIPVYVVNDTNPAIQGYAISPSYMANGDETFGGAIFLKSNHIQESVLAHELAHILLDAQHQPSPNALWPDYYANIERHGTNIWFANQGLKNQWSEIGIAAHRRLAETMRSRSWKSPYAKLPPP